jgi:hypothetical protein
MWLPAPRAPPPPENSSSFSFSCGFRVDFVQQFKYTGSRLHYTAHSRATARPANAPPRPTLHSEPQGTPSSPQEGLVRHLNKLAASAVAVHPAPTFGSEARVLTASTVKRKLQLPHNSQARKPEVSKARQAGSSQAATLQLITNYQKSTHSAAATRTTTSTGTPHYHYRRRERLMRPIFRYRQ